MNPGTPTQPSPGRKTRQARWIAGGFIVAITAALLLMRGGHNSAEPNNSDRNPSSASREKVPATVASEPTPTAVLNQNSAPENSASKSAPVNPADSATTGPEKTRASQRDSVVSSSGKRKSLIDPMASWSDTPPWPEGPRLFAEVETSARKYINLRPDDYGVMPRVLADAEERIELTINFPEGEPGEKIHVELPNGGAFTDTEARGRIYVLPENRTLSFPYITDDARGHCNVKFFHRGHSRSLPVWVGELPEFATAVAEP